MATVAPAAPLAHGLRRSFSRPKSTPVSKRMLPPSPSTHAAARQSRMMACAGMICRAGSPTNTADISCAPHQLTSPRPKDAPGSRAGGGSETSSSLCMEISGPASASPAPGIEGRRFSPPYAHEFNASTSMIRPAPGSIGRPNIRHPHGRSASRRSCCPHLSRLLGSRLCPPQHQEKLEAVTGKNGGFANPSSSQHHPTYGPASRLARDWVTNDLGHLAFPTLSCAAWTNVAAAQKLKNSPRTTLATAAKHDHESLPITANSGWADI